MPRCHPAALVLVAFVALAIVAACDDNDEPSATATSTPPAAASPTLGATETPGPATPEPGLTETPEFQGAQEPVEGSLGVRSGVPPVPVLNDVRVAEHEGFDRIVFEFNRAPPDYKVEYVTEATGCATGEPAFQVVGRAFFLQIRFTPAQAHNDAGATTIDATELEPKLPSIVSAKQTCDFEADVTWALLLDERLDFRVYELADPLRLAVDLAHP